MQKYGPQDCIPKIQEAVKVIDQVLDLGEPYATELKTRFGLNGLQNDDFGSVLTKSFLAFQYAEIEAPLSFNTFTNTFCPAIRQTRLASNATIGGIAL